MSEVSVHKIPEEHRSKTGEEYALSVGMNTIFSSEADAKKLRDALCVMFGRPGKAGKEKR